jgi:uncharacterized protein (DUF433 family)
MVKYPKPLVFARINSMRTITLSETTYSLLARRAKEKSKTPDSIADELLYKNLSPEHPHIEVISKTTGRQAMLKGTRVPVSILVGYTQVGETPQTIVENILPSLTLAQVYDALSYYDEHREEIDQEILENTEEHGRAYLREQLGEYDYLKLTGQKP